MIGHDVKRRLNERGDTLVEVTIALAILAMILTGSFVAANKAFRLGQDAKERSQLVGNAQQQAEALQSFRDSHTWNEFEHGNSTGLPGIDIRAATGGCIQPCFHMVRQTINGLNQWVPQAGPGTDSGQLGGQGYMRITVLNNAPLAGVPAAYDFVISYGVPRAGGGTDLASSIRLRLTNLDRLRQ